MYPNGPWKTLFDGKFDDYPMQILLSQEGILINQIFSSDKSKVAVTLIGISKVDGDAETFFETLQKRNIYFVIKNKKASKFVLIFRDQEVFDKDSEELYKFITKECEEITKTINQTASIANPYEIKLIQYKDMDADARKDIFSNPSIISPIFSTSIYHSEAKHENIVDDILEINLGFIKSTKDKSKENINLFEATNVVIYKDKETRNKLVKIMAEEFALKGISSVIITDDLELENIKYPSDNAESINNTLGVEATGFPAVKYEIDNIGIDLSDIPENGISDIYEIGSSRIRSIINDAIKSGAKTADELVKKIESIPVSDKVTNYEISTARRMILTIDKLHKNLYKNKFDYESLSKTANQKLGRTNILELSKDSIVNKVAVCSIISKVLKSNKKCAIIISDAKDLVHKVAKDSIQKKILDMLKENHGKYVFIASDSELNLNDEILVNANVSLSILSKDDIAIKIRNSRPYRIEPRLTMSR